MPELSIMRQALARGTFQREEARALLEQAQAVYARYAHHAGLGEHAAALRALVRASALWTHATYKEFLEEQLVKAPPPEAYRPLE